jgi:hypothetical protein
MNNLGKVHDKEMKEFEIKENKLMESHDQDKNTQMKFETKRLDAVNEKNL